MIGAWSLGPNDRELAGDLDADGKHEVYVRSPDKAGLLKLVDDCFCLQALYEDQIDGWTLDASDTELIGRFTQKSRDEVLIRNSRSLGLLYWDPCQCRLRLDHVQHDRIDDWTLQQRDRQVVGDFDGDDLDEIYIWADQRAGVIKYRNGRFGLDWVGSGSIAAIDEEHGHSIELNPSDRYYPGRFLPDRSGVLHRTDNAVAVLTWENGQMRVRHHQEGWIGPWRLGPGNRFLLGDFHRIGPDIADPLLDFIRDDLTDVFIHSTWGTGMIGVNYAQLDPNNPDIHEKMGLTWINEREILQYSLELGDFPDDDLLAATGCLLL